MTVFWNGSLRVAIFCSAIRHRKKVDKSSRIRCEMWDFRDSKVVKTYTTQVPASVMAAGRNQS